MAGAGDDEDGVPAVVADRVALDRLAAPGHLDPVAVAGDQVAVSRGLADGNIEVIQTHSITVESQVGLANGQWLRNGRKVEGCVANPSATLECQLIGLFQGSAGGEVQRDYT